VEAVVSPLFQFAQEGQARDGVHVYVLKGCCP
jgi:hypothetical protein